MIIDVNGKRIVFGMQWHTRLTEGDVHREARAAKSPFLYHAEQAFYYGILNDTDKKEKLKAPLYSGAIALMHRYPDAKNLAMVLEVPGHGYIVCAIHQGRPRNGYDEILATEVEVHSRLQDFKQICGAESFRLYGDAPLPAIEPASMDDIVKALDSTSQLKRVNSAFVSPLVVVVVVAALGGAAWYGMSVVKKYRQAEAQKAALAAQKSSKQMYADEMAARRNDFVLAARSLPDVLVPIRDTPFSIGGWLLKKATCDVSSPEKQMVCRYEYSRSEKSRGTYKTFSERAKFFDSVDYSGEAIKTTKAYKKLPFIKQGVVMDAATPGAETLIEFGSTLQSLRRFGTTKFDEAKPYGVPSSANLAELDSLELGASKWELSGPIRVSGALANFPKYATLAQIVINVSDKPAYSLTQSIAMMTLTGTTFSKPNQLNTK